MEQLLDQKSKGGMDHLEIMATIPHRHPFLLVDGILEKEGMEAITGFKNVSHNDPYLIRDGDRKPYLPVSILIECMSQVGAVGILSHPENKGKIMLFAALEDFRLFRPVYAGDQLVSRVEKVYLKAGLGKMRGTGHVKNDLVSEGFFSFAVVDKVPQL